jgi:hypothetical protein
MLKVVYGIEGVCLMVGWVCMIASPTLLKLTKTPTGPSTQKRLSLLVLFMTILTLLVTLLASQARIGATSHHTPWRADGGRGTGPH